MSNKQNAQAAVALLDAFRQQVPERPERLPTFMEVAGYPHYENVCSNILAFFFDPGKPHGLGTLFLDAVARVGCIEDQAGAAGGNVQVDREVRTRAGNFIDIFIQSDSSAILIENKIFAGYDANPFADYAEHLDSLPEQLDKHKLLLTLTPVGESTERYGFLNITHGQLVEKIRGLLGDYVGSADTRYLTFVLDFLNTLDYLQGGMVMNPEFIHFLASRSGDVGDFLKEINAFKDELREKVTRLQNLIDVASYSNVHQWKYREREALFDILVHDITVAPDSVVAVNTKVAPEGWEVQIFPRKGNLRLQELLQNLEIPFEEGERLTLPTCFVYAEDFGNIAQVVRDVVCKLARSGGAS